MLILQRGTFQYTVDQPSAFSSSHFFFVKSAFIMTRRIDRLLLILAVGILYISFTNGQERDPAAVKSDSTSNGIVGQIMIWINPFTKIALQYVNAMLIRNKGLKLPCTLYNPVKWDWECKKVEN